MITVSRFIFLLFVAVCSAAIPCFAQPDKQLQITNMDSNGDFFINELPRRDFKTIIKDTVITGDVFFRCEGYYAHHIGYNCGLVRIRSADNKTLFNLIVHPGEPMPDSGKVTIGLSPYRRDAADLQKNMNGMVCDSISRNYAFVVRLSESERFKLLHDPSRRQIELSRMHIDSSGYISWSYFSKADTLNFRLEVFKWNKWIPVKAFQTYRGSEWWQRNTDTVAVSFHSGTNRFRLRFEQPCTWVSPEVIYENKKGKPCNWPLRVTDELILESEQEWCIYNAYGNFIMKGNSRNIVLNKLDKGSYFLIGEKQIIEFIRQ